MLYLNFELEMIELVAMRRKNKPRGRRTTLVTTRACGIGWGVEVGLIGLYGVTMGVSLE